VPAGDSRGLVIAPVTPGRWRDLARLFGPRGACAAPASARTVSRRATTRAARRG